MIECYYQKCPSHEANITPYGRESEPFCTQKECTAKAADMMRWERERREELDVMRKV
jgi:hypothetical protein